ncbi:hypothetical protein lerEdw1_009169 [Lerista edwardsae]|nr:hypothetical protein lerEdw1_009169 [Lerista edwardsae]
MGGFSDISIMSSNEEEKTASPESTAHEQQCAMNKVAALPLVSSACGMVSTTYTTAKESHPTIQAVCDMAEMGVKTIVTSAASTAQPLLNKLEPQIAAANNYACKGVDKLQETLPDLHQTVEKVVLDAKDLVSSVKYSPCTRANEAKEVVLSVVGGAKEAAQESMEMAKSAMLSSLNTMKTTTVGQMAACSLDKMLEKSEESVDHYLPITEEELAILAAELDGSGTGSIEKQQQQGYYVRLGTLSTKLRNRAYRHTLGKLQKLKQSAQEMLTQLQQATELMEYTKKAVDQKVEGSEEKLQQLWLEWNKSLPGLSQTLEENPIEMESQTLSVFYNIAQQMQAVCQNLLANMQGLPAALQEKVQQAYGSMEKLQAAFSCAKSFQDISTALVNQSQEKISKAREVVDEVMEYVMQDVPLTWVVGPFSPAITAVAEPPEVQAKVDDA